MKSFQNPSDEKLKEILKTAKTIAIVGASANPDRPSYGIMQRMLALGYRVIPVNPVQTEILGQKVYPNLAAIPEKIDIVDVFRRAEDTPPVAREAVAVGAKTLWLQLGIHSEEAAEIGLKGGLNVVTNNCIAVTHSYLGVKH